jgi:energy-coupling factor transport system ATP-binding protein
MEQEDPFMLTKGERQRVAVASILAQRPQVIILDEPTTGLDYRETRSMMDLVKRLNEAGHTIIAVTHSMWVVAEYARRTIVVHEGRIMLDGPTRDVMAREADLRVASLKPPAIVQLGNRFGTPLLTVDEGVRALVRG